MELNVESLNAPYAIDAFHAELIRLAGTEPSSVVLDVGCGVGHTVRAAAAVATKVVGIDRSTDFLDSARRLLAEAIEAGRVDLRVADIDDGKLPFADGEFDAVICQNVLECVSDKPRLVQDCHRVLRDGGIFLLGHHDFGGVMLNGGKPLLTRQIVAAYADETQAWMTSSDGEMGRKLPGLMRSAGFRSVQTETRLFIELGFSDGDYAQDYCRSAKDAALRAQVPPSDVDAWVADLAELDRCGEFYFALPWVYVRAMK